MSGAKLQSESVSQHSPSERKLRQDGFGISWLALQWLGCKLFAHRSEVPWKALHSRLTQLVKQGSGASLEDKRKSHSEANTHTRNEKPTMLQLKLPCTVVSGPMAPRFGHTGDSCKKM